MQLQHAPYLRIMLFDNHLIQAGAMKRSAHTDSMLADSPQQTVDSNRQDRIEVLRVNSLDLTFLYNIRLEKSPARLWLQPDGYTLIGR